MDSKMDDIPFIDAGLPAELNNLRTAELLNGISCSYPIIFTNSDNETFGDPLGADHVLEYENTQGSPELPNSTVTNTPPATCSHPCTEDFEGTYGFNICQDALVGSARSSNSWAYSDSLKTVFIKMSNVLMIQFKTSRSLGEYKFFIRAVLVYQNNDFVNQAVSRCSIHAMEDDPGQNSHKFPGQCSCDQYNHAGHVLRCHTEGAMYDYDATSQRHSVLVAVPPVPLAGSNFLKAVHYFFTCKTSCPLGMQRRAVQIIFTLEDSRCQIYGRKVLPVKICSCPKRDKDRQERDLKALETKTEEVPEQPPQKRLKTVSEDVKPTKTDIDHQLFLMQIRQATRESLLLYLKKLVSEQGKDLAAQQKQTAEIRQLHGQIAEITAKISELQVALEATEKSLELRQVEVQEITQRLGQSRNQT